MRRNTALPPLRRIRYLVPKSGGTLGRFLSGAIEQAFRPRAAGGRTQVRRTRTWCPPTHEGPRSRSWRRTGSRRRRRGRGRCGPRRPGAPRLASHLQRGLGHEAEVLEPHRFMPTERHLHLDAVDLVARVGDAGLTQHVGGAVLARLRVHRATLGEHHRSRANASKSTLRYRATARAFSDWGGTRYL